MFKLFSCIAMVMLLAACDSSAESDGSATLSSDISAAEPVKMEAAPETVAADPEPVPVSVASEQKITDSIEDAADSVSEPEPVAVEKEIPESVKAAAVSEEKYVAGKHYRVLARPIPTQDPNKVEVAEFFWYGCSHCYAFEPQITSYKGTAPEFVNVVPVPTMWRNNMIVHAKAYYAMKNLKKPELHEVLFQAINEQRNPLANDEAIAKLFAEHGVDKEKTMKMLSSFGVSSQVQKAQSLAKGAKISGTPTLVVNGKYVVETGLAGSQANMLKIADYLARKENAN